MNTIGSWSPPEPSLVATAGWFAAGGIVTAAFSGSLIRLAPHTPTAEVLSLGMVVPSFTWAIQLIASALAMTSPQRRTYWNDLGCTCLLGSVALLPAAVANLALSQPPWWLSAANVLVSVAAMGATLRDLSSRHGISPIWPLGWVVTITANMLLFLWVSRRWWATT